jgi:hypothetical protein
MPYSQGRGYGSGQAGNTFFGYICGRNPMAFQNFPSDQFSQKIPMPMPIQLLDIL